MKRTLLAAGLLVAFGAAQAAATLQWNTIDTKTRSEAFNLPWLTLAAGTSVDRGYLSATGPGTISFTYLGQESAYSDKLHMTTGSGHVLTEAGTAGVTSFSELIGAGTVAFKFEGDSGKFAFNGLASGWAKGTSIGLIDTTNATKYKGQFQYVLGYNDSAGDAHMGDWDDFVVGVNFVAAPIPEPETYALMLAGLGAVGLMARRRQRRG